MVIIVVLVVVVVVLLIVVVVVIEVVVMIVVVVVVVVLVLVVVVLLIVVVVVIEIVVVLMIVVVVVVVVMIVVLVVALMCGIESGGWLAHLPISSLRPSELLLEVSLRKASLYMRSGPTISLPGSPCNLPTLVSIGDSTLSPLKSFPRAKAHSCQQHNARPC